MPPDPSPRPEPPTAAHMDAAAPSLEATVDAAAAKLVSILDEYLVDLKAGRAPSRQELIARHPELASQLEACLAGLEFIHGAESAAPGSAQTLGDFRIIREVGRGGMGAVFEAEQISLHRSVALKILRYGAVSDPESIERFKREAETVAKLHHTNIVPIFNVGSEHGVNYYAMQFIPGRSLAEVLSEHGGPLPANQVAQWGLQAAEALAHAHQRGVIHRDVKPSNLLLDGENRLWLTDFGLARRMDDVTLSLTGAILGTPRYMSPEQAAAAHRRVDHRTDLFSLSATLYELLTGQPAFAGHSPHEVIQSILTSEPVPIRQLVSSVPRDLETIVMKSLSKEPGQRYHSASELAADFRALIDGRPIRARRAGIVERTTRWVKRQQQSVKLAATAVAITLLVTFGGLLGWYSYAAWRKASIKFNATKPPLVIEILDPGDQLVRVETAPMQNAVDVPAGDYHVRVTADGKLSETFEMALPRGSEAEFTLDLDDQLLWKPRPIERGFDVVDFGDEQGVVLWNEQSIGLQKHSHPRGWNGELLAKQLSVAENAPGFRWPWNRTWQQHSGYGPFDLRPWVAPRALDIDSRGLGDLIVAGRHQAWLMAISGDEGNILWFAARGHDLAGAATQAGSAVGREGVHSAVLGDPIVGPDCDADGTADVIATIADIGPQPTLIGDRYVAKCSVEAISGKTGQSIWSYVIPPAWFDLPAGEEVPYDLRWFAGTDSGTSSGGGGSMNTGRHRIRDGGQRFERTGPHTYRPASVSLVTDAGTSRLAIVAGTRLIELDPATGNANGESIDLGVRPGMECQWADVDGDGAPDLVLMERVSPSKAGFMAPVTARLVVWSSLQRKTLWAKNLNARWPKQPSWIVEAPRWPLVADLDGDKKCEIVVPDGSSRGNGRGGYRLSSEIPWGVVAVLAGETGEPLWTRRLVSMDQQVDHVVVGPDLDRDGHRELYAATLAGSEFRGYLDALSGKNGNTLWTNSFAVPPDRNSSSQYYLAPPQWWHAGSDGWPQVLVQLVEADFGDHRTLVGAFSAATGNLSHVGNNITAVQPADIDGDGTEDLLVYDSRSPSALDLGGSLQCVRGVASESWARLGDTGDPLADFDGDGTQDLLAGHPSETITATSGATGAILWRSQVSENLRKYQVRSASAHPGGGADLNGDGTDDLLGWTHLAHHHRQASPFFAVCGKTGSKLWEASEIAVQMLSGVSHIAAYDLDGDGNLEVLWLAALDYGYPLRDGTSSHESQLWLFVTSGQTGKLRWSHPLSVPFGQTPGSVMQLMGKDLVVSPTVGDVNDDGTRDVLVPELLPDGNSLQTLALSGTDGSVLWSRPYPQDTTRQTSLAYWVPPTLCDFDGDGQSEVVMVELMNSDESGNPIHPSYRVVSVQGRDGGEIWSWNSEIEVDHWRPSAGATRAELTRPQRLRSGEQGCRVAVLLPGHQGSIVVFDHRGLLQQRKANGQTSASGIWACDAEDDGVDELVFSDEFSLCVAAADQLDRPLWTQSLKSQYRICGILSGEANGSPVVAVASGSDDNSVLGFDVATGKQVWSCPGVIWRGEGLYFALQRFALLEGKSPLPRVYYSYGSVSRCRQAIPTRGSERIAHSPSLVSVLNHRDPRKAALAPPDSPSHDDRWARDLPWVERHASPQEIATLILWSLVFALLLVVLPIGFLVRLLMVRRFGIGTLLVVPVVAGLVLTACLIKVPIEREFEDILARLTMGFVFSPVIVAVGLILLWLIRGQWRRILLWLATALIVSGICAAVMLWVAARENPQLLPEVHYDFAGWYLIGLLGAFLTTWLLIIVLPSKRLGIWAVNRFRRRYRTPPTQLPEPDRTMAA